MSEIKPNPNPSSITSTESTAQPVSPTPQQFLDCLPVRRSINALAHRSHISDDDILSLVQAAIKHVPSPFNSQSTRCLILVGDQHYKLWDMASEIIRPIVDDKSWAFFSGKIAEYRAGYGSVVFFDDHDVFKATEKQLGPQRWAGVAAQMPLWEEHSSGMSQYAVWTALSLAGFGCNLQHYSPKIEKQVKEHYKLPDSWHMKSQLVFGTPTGGPRAEKTFVDVKERVTLLK